MKKNLKPIYFLSLLLFSLPSDIQASNLCNTNDSESSDKYRYPYLRDKDLDYYKDLPVGEQPNFLRRILIESEKHVQDMKLAAIKEPHPLHKGFIYYLIGTSILRRKPHYTKLEKVHEVSTPLEKVESTRLTIDAKVYFEEAEKEFVKELGLQNSEKFQAIYGGQDGNYLFYYAHTIKLLEHLATTSEMKILYLNKLKALVMELSKKPDVCLNASCEKIKYPSTGLTHCGESMYLSTIFARLGYTGQLKSLFKGVSIEGLFLFDPMFILCSIDLRRRVLEDPKTDVSLVLNEWVPKLELSTQVELRLTIKEAQPEASTSQ